jgi:hypothetical protein
VKRLKKVVPVVVDNALHAVMKTLFKKQDTTRHGTLDLLNNFEGLL